MLVLKRKVNESIMIGNEIEIKVISLDKDGVRIGIEAPKDLPVYRKEIYLAIAEENREAVKGDKRHIQLLAEWFRDMPKPEK